MDKMILILLVLAAVVYFLFFRSGGNSEAAAENKKLGAEFLAANKTEEGVVETSSGLQYLVLQKGTGTVHPSARDKVKVH
ncbi:MAG: FKBP-type peptidyl-prolyl cis-trans isomerase N-terminal domain-containing protein [Kangiellaceae bacterium]|nr:FKBP-type peptidyl-prolyl cis-trans isomerase N-terminal domain-containing protein [Kangiellaceae bacterium]